MDLILQHSEKKYITLQPDFKYYRENKQIADGVMRQCAGPCKQRRSIGQYVAGDLLCMKCRLRAPKGMA